MNDNQTKPTNEVRLIINLPTFILAWFIWTLFCIGMGLAVSIFIQRERTFINHYYDGDESMGFRGDVAIPKTTKQGRKKK